MANDATFTFRLVEEGGAPGAKGVPGGDPMARPQTGERTASREAAEVQGGGSAKIVQEAQQKTEAAKPRVQLPKPQEIVDAEIVKSRLEAAGDFGRDAGKEVLQRVGLGRFASLLGAGVGPLAVIGAVAGAGALISRRQAQLAQQLRPFSPDLLASQARENLRTTLQNIELAQQFGPQLAEAERQRGRLGAAAGRFGAGIAGGPIGQDVGDIVELAARAFDGINAISTTIQNAFRVSGVGSLLAELSNINKGLEALGVGVDEFADVKAGVPLFREFPHAEVRIFPDGLDVGNFRQTGETTEFQLNEPILGQL